MPVGHRATSETHFENLRSFEDGVQRHVSAVTPSMNSDTIRIDIGLRFKPDTAITLIGKFLGAETVMNGLFEHVPASRRAAIIERKNDVALLRHHLMPQILVVHPLIHDHLGMWSTISVNKHRIFL